jgi:pimeloyl-ACP methyl ester carboxylesterase
MVDKSNNSGGKIITPHITQIGNGPAVVCFHCSTSSSKQWQPLMQILSGKYTVIAVDLYGYGKTPPWQGENRLTLKNEAALVEHVFNTCDSSPILIGHSYGGAVAMTAALMYPDCVNGLVIYEPALFNLLFEDTESLASVAEILSVERTVNGLLMADCREEASRHFVDYWSGKDAFDRLPEWQQNAVMDKIEKVLMDFDAAFRNRDFLVDYSSITKHALLLYGLDSPSTTRRITQLLASTLPNSEVRGILGYGHMAPITHSEEVNKVIENFLGYITNKNT